MYEIDALGGEVILIELVTVTCGHAFAAGIVYVTVYVPGVLEIGNTEPVEASTDTPAGAEKIPPLVPVSVTD